MLKKFFEINLKKYGAKEDRYVYRPASLNHPKDEAVMFITEGFIDKIDAFRKCRGCLIFWPDWMEVPEDIKDRHILVPCRNPHTRYCEFYQENHITYLPEKEDVRLVEGAWISPKADIGERVTIFPGAYIGGEVKIGNDVYIGSGVRLIGDISIGSGTIIRENTVIGADGLSTDRDEQGKAVTMPQFGGVVIEESVQIGANVTIGRGAIDNTVIHTGCKIDNNCFISHNVEVGEDTFVVGETIMFGSSSTGKQVYISGNATIRNGIHIGDRALIGMGAVVVKNVPADSTVKGNPAR